MTKANYQCGRTVVSGRTFLIEFWEEDHFGLPWVRISEIKTKQAKRYFLFGDLIDKEYIDVIDEGWTAENRLEWAINRIRREIEREAEREAEMLQISEFCSGRASV